MSPRDRLNSTGAALLSRSPDLTSAATRARSAELFADLSPEERADLLRFLAQQQILPSNFHLPTPVAANSERIREALKLIATPNALSPLNPPNVLTETSLDCLQKLAVCRALSTPDFCLIEGLPGTGKSTVALEIIKQSLQRGESVLLIGGTAASVDWIVARLASEPLARLHRCLPKDEMVSDASEAARAFSSQARARHVQYNLLPRLRLELETARTRLRALERAETLLSQLAGLVNRHADIARRGQELVQQLSMVAVSVQNDTTQPGPLADALDRLIVQRDAELGRLDDQIRQAENELGTAAATIEGINQQLETIAPLAEAKQHSRWWTGAFWKATISGNVAAKVEELLREKTHAETVQITAHHRIEQLQAQKKQVVQECNGSRESAIAVEIARRQADLQQKQEALRSEQEAVDAVWHRTCDELPSDIRPTAVTLAAISASRQAAEIALADARRAETQVTRESKWLETYLDDILFAQHWASNVVAGTPNDFSADPIFADSLRLRGFDVLLIEDAQFLSEAEFISVARRAVRWVLLADPVADLPRPRFETRTNRPRPGQRPAPARNTPAGPSFFARLWQQLHWDVWVREGDRLCCRFRPVPPLQRGELMCEPLVDCPDIEVRIYAPQDQPPALAEMVFPSSTLPAHARVTLLKETGELPLQTRGDLHEWLETEGKIVYSVGEAVGIPQPVRHVEAGVTEWVSETFGAHHRTGDNRPIPTYTCSIEFDQAAGWDRARAEAWVSEHIVRLGLGRTTRLDLPHRFAGPLAAFISDLFAPGGYAITDKSEAIVEFLPVPMPALEERKARGEEHNGSTRPNRPGRWIPVSLRMGAGLELDISDPRQRELLPSEVREQLPATGLVNLAEARAIVKLLETSDLRPAITALTFAQVELLRALVKLSPSLSASAGSLVIETPQLLRQREFEAVVVSLTRSHSHRAVTIGETPAVPALAFSRARKHLILVGDPGTLARRNIWDGPVDHLDEYLASREKSWVGRLTQYLHGHGPKLVGLRICERLETVPAHESNDSGDLTRDGDSLIQK